MSIAPRRKRSYRHVSQELEASLKDIYGDDQNLDLTTIERRHHSRFTSFLFRLVGFLFLLALVSWGGFLWWQSSGVSEPSQPLEIKIEAPEKIISGASTCFTVRYENIGRVPIAALAMSLNLPETFEIKETKPVAEENNHWLMSPLGAGSDGSVNICGIFRSNLPASEKIQAIFTYRPANFSSDFQDIVGETLNIDQSVVSLEISGPKEIIVGDQTTYTAKIKNTDSEKIENLRLRAILPESFTFVSSQPEVAEVGSIFWNLASLEPGAEQIIEFTGSFTSSASGLIPMVVEVGFINSEETFIKQTEVQTETNILGGELSFQLFVNGSDQNQTADLGGRLRMSLSFANQSKEVLKDLIFTLNLDGLGKDLPLNFTDSDLSGGVKSGNSVYWGKKELPTLASLEPDTQGTIDFFLIIDGYLDPEETDTITAQIQAEIGKTGSIESDRTITSNPITIQFNSDTALNTEARYYDDEGLPVGSGPLPPRVGETTTYRIFWHLENSLHNLKNITISSTLPSDVSWTDNIQASDGSITYNTTTRQIVWIIDDLVKEKTSILAWFDLAIAPTTGDVGSFFHLVNPTTFEATDTTTKDLLHSSTDALTTALPNDDLAAGKGVVE
ncbi:MAG: hypothetical protein UX09_C0008G0005 [Candidatus Uhrbacteria bacterium GW2011_GWE2_45_35]|uniref:DUF11 domain-containing protein n=2 Tax=Candidatus Uhriibacteriota TaxID=1752732 RepID=A0A0G1JKF3_9BACT|nr:MAG: hypothetical protein UW63_C0006G0004 [Candidatus Uhrbacteria bacterium GW2011_GWF2_44_350]KKU08937.1 MAG: hypothetical protein UX09_C0008G0005 [Candidatus Uhrbacteria bacterium GW2011_GWE2_45_35]HBR81086.1 hypothetical protein [Candidatus Uhrbacteria bacterium]HCU32042.1 hypothetical protein [Candidatus Uhrbacteria bacterium]